MDPLMGLDEHLSKAAPGWQALNVVQETFGGSWKLDRELDLTQAKEAQEDPKNERRRQMARDIHSRFPYCQGLMVSIWGGSWSPRNV